MTIAPAVGMALLAFFIVIQGNRGLPVHLVRRGFQVAALWFFVSIVLGASTVVLPVYFGPTTLAWLAFLSITSFATAAFIGFRAVLDLFGTERKV